MHPVLLSLPFGLTLYGYGTMLGLALLVGWHLTLALCERDGLGRERMATCVLWTFLAALVGARLLFVLTNLERFHHPADLLRVWQGGMVAYGGFLGGLLGSALFCRRRGVSLLAWADCAVPSLATGLMLTRAGCLLAGCDFGQPWDGPWAVRFPAGSPAYAQQQLEGLLAPGAPQSLPVHPTQVYEALAGLLLLGLILGVRRRRAFSGQAFAAFVMGYAVLRSLIEGLRADADRGGLGPLSTSQLIGLVTFVLGAALWLALRRRSRRDPASLRLWERGRAVPGPGATA